MMEQCCNFTLKCFSCGNEVEVAANREPRFSFEIVQAANDCGFYGVFDMAHSRSLVFCSKQCADNQRKKDGSFRVRPKKIIINN